ncbi:hypothetical protein EYF80_065442 [Liparis tanakae]|uniref:Uncharacterized protein n=1 Tax=Liparis tanakae TaxID=230148 RepID=A0A4Z2E704_9TELE|nr:hypothetical protein EYF80_065442 [Liparis tanakae]
MLQPPSVSLCMPGASCARHLRKQSVFQLSAKAKTVSGTHPIRKSLSPIAAIRFAELQAVGLDSEADSAHSSILEDNAFMAFNVTFAS